MNLREEYGSDALDGIFCFFMRAILRIQKRGCAEIPVDLQLAEPMDAFLRKAVKLIECAQPPEISALILESELYAMQSRGGLSREDALQLLLIKELSLHIHFDEDPVEYLFSTVNLWRDRANEYAIKTFYGNLPAETRKKHQLDWMLANVPESFLKLDDF